MDTTSFNLNFCYGRYRCFQPEIALQRSPRSPFLPSAGCSAGSLIALRGPPLRESPDDAVPPLTDRFTTRPEEKNDLGFSDIAIYHRMSGPNGGPRKPRIVLVVQFKRVTGWLT